MPGNDTMPGNKTMRPHRADGRLAAPPRVLLVDRNQRHRAALRLLLEQAQMTVYDVASAVEAMAVARTVRPDVALIDLGLPDRDGMDLAASLMHLLGTVKVLVQTDSDGAAIAPLARQVGVADVLVTGMDPARVLAAFQRATALARGDRPAPGLPYRGRS